MIKIEWRALEAGRKGGRGVLIGWVAGGTRLAMHDWQEARQQRLSLPHSECPKTAH